MAPHIKEGHEQDIAPMKLFRQMPGAFPEDAPELAPPEPKLDDAQQAERARRLAIPRIQRPTKS